jgi:hypothetical protein
MGLDPQETNRFDPPADRHVAVLNKKIVGAGRNPRQLRQDIAAQYQVPPERVVITFVEGPNSPVILGIYPPEESDSWYSQGRPRLEER